MDIYSPVSELPLVGPIYLSKLKRLGINFIKDLLYHVPSRYEDFRLISKIARVQAGELVTIKGKIESATNIYSKSGKKFQIAEISDDSGSIKAIWFNQPYLVRNLPTGEMVSFSGKVSWLSRKIAIISPEYEKIVEGMNLIHTGRLVPIYPETGGLSSKWLRGRVSYLLRNYGLKIEDYLPQEDTKRFNFKNLETSVNYVHFPNDMNEAEKGRIRLAFDELLFLQLRGLLRRHKWKSGNATYKIKTDKNIYNDFVKTLPFTLTSSQMTSVSEIFYDLGQDSPMNRLLEGDVGSGKTVVAASACFASFVNGFQSVIMAPTQILAQQHFQTLNDIFSQFKIRVKLVTSEGVKGDVGSADVYIGTHALIHRVLETERVSLVVIDEQHRFGVEQREHLIKQVGKKSKSPHVLTMTATPIPRTIALTLYGDLDLSILKELPEGRVPITTWTVPPQKREGAYGWIDKEIKENKVQAFIICPLIEESEVETMKDVRAVTTEYEKLKQIFKNLKVGLLHGRLKAKEKEKIINNFKKGYIDILISTPVVEVGIDVPNATIMVIEASERFGLAQLHQLRGRVGRSTKKSYCLLFTESRSKKVEERLTALKRSASGFELAELDLKMRGPGEIFGTSQHGFPELKIASWQDEELIKKTKDFAEKIINNKKKYKILLDRVIESISSPN